MQRLAPTNLLPVPVVIWGEADPLKRGPLICSDKQYAPLNCIGSYGGQYGLYRAAAVAAGQLKPHHRPDYTDAVSSLKFRQNPHWSGDNAIASFDPFGHLVTEHFGEYIEQGFNVRPTCAITRTENNPPEIRKAMERGDLIPDGKVLLPDGSINLTKVVIQPVWFLPGMAKYYGTDEGPFREGIHYNLGGAYDALISRPELKVFLPSFGETTVYIIGDFDRVGRPGVTHAARTHDKCASSDTHSAKICSCRPALMWGYEEGVRVAQDGGVALIVYTEAEGRGHGPVDKNLVYNARSAGADRPEDYFLATQRITGITELRNQRLPTDVYRWMGVKQIDVWMSGSPHKSAAMKAAGIEIVAECPVPPSRLDDGTARVEWVAKQMGGYHYQDRCEHIL